MVTSSTSVWPSGRGDEPLTPRSPVWTLRVPRGALGPPRQTRNSYLDAKRLKGGVDDIDRTSRLVPPNYPTGQHDFTPLSPGLSLPNKREVVLENMRLYQRIAALQRNEKTLRNDNRNLSRYMLSLQQEDEECQQAWENEVREMEEAFEAKLKELELLAQRQKDRLREMAMRRTPPPAPTPPAASRRPPSPPPPSVSQRSTSPSRPAMVSTSTSALVSRRSLARSQSPPRSQLATPLSSRLPISRSLSPPRPQPKHPTLSDSDLTAWFNTRGNSWYEWAEDYAYQDPDKLSRLDMIQERELCTRVKSFVRLTDEGKLPPELLVDRRINSSQILLHGMLANYVVTEILESPLWIFRALNVDRAKFLSPDSSPVSPLTRGGGPDANDQFGFSLKSTGLSLTEGLPSMRDMDKLQDLFFKAQVDNGEVHKWRSQLMRTLTEGGLSHDHMKVTTTKNMRRLVRARREYAKVLKEQFLSGPARLLLRDQDAAGIERLEWRLVNELDMALRLSAQVWSYQTCDLGIRGIKEFGTQWYDTGEDMYGYGGGGMELCQAQQMELSIREGDKHEVIAVLRPEIRAMGIGDGSTTGGGDLAHYHHHHRHHYRDGTGGGGGADNDGDDGLDGVWAKAQVFVSPRSVVEADDMEGRGRSRPGSRERRPAGGSVTAGIALGHG